MHLTRKKTTTTKKKNLGNSLRALGFRLAGRDVVMGRLREEKVRQSQI